MPPGYRAPVYRNVSTSLVWSDITAASTMVAPDTDENIDIRNCKDIVIQLATQHANNDCDDADLNVLTTMDETGATNYDTVPFEEMNIGDASAKSLVVLPGAAFMRLRADNNTAASTLTATAYVLMRV